MNINDVGLCLDSTFIRQTLGEGNSHEDVAAAGLMQAGVTSDRQVNQSIRVWGEEIP